MNVEHFTISHRGGKYHIAKIDAGKERIEICESPTGRSVQVFVGAEKVYPTYAKGEK